MPSFKSVLRTTALALALLLVPGTALARQQGLPTPVPPAAVTQDVRAVQEVQGGPALRPALWLVRDEDTVIYLFGTVHLLKPGLNWLTGPVADALTRSDTLVTEIVKTPEGDLALQGAVMELALLPEGHSLRSLMLPERRHAFEALLVREGIAADSFDAYEPWYPALVLSMLPLIKHGMVPEAGVEAKLAQIHGSRPKEALENAREQIQLFDTLSQGAQLAYLDSVVANYDTIGSQMEDLVSAWGKGDAEAIGAAMTANFDSPEVIDALIRKRNKAWADWIARRMARPGTLFLAVGAGHLAGPDSVQHYLSLAGVKTDRVQ